MKQFYCSNWKDLSRRMGFWPELMYLKEKSWLVPFHIKTLLLLAGLKKNIQKCLSVAKNRFEISVLQTILHLELSQKNYLLT